MGRLSPALGQGRSGALLAERQFDDEPDDRAGGGRGGDGARPVAGGVGVVGGVQVGPRDVRGAGRGRGVHRAGGAVDQQWEGGAVGPPEADWRAVSAENRSKTALFQTNVPVIRTGVFVVPVSCVKFSRNILDPWQNPRK